MSCETFIPKVFNPKHQELIDTAASIITAYQSQGYDLSLRQLYYQFVAHHGLPNTEQNYKMLGGVISDARLAGELDWDALVDRGRETLENPHWDSPADVIEAAAQGYWIDLWEDQPCHVEVMVEKQALEGVLVPVCRRLDVPFTANKGYSSSSAMYSAGKRIEEKLEVGKKIVILYLGDHDPSGIDMSRDVEERLGLFSGAYVYDEFEKKPLPVAEFGAEGDQPSFVVERIALNMEQVRAYDPPPNPAKLTDTRAGGYIRKFGRESWELDALDPETLAELVTTRVKNHIDADVWEARTKRWLDERDVLKKMAEEYRALQDGEQGEKE